MSPEATARAFDAVLDVLPGGAGKPPARKAPESMIDLEFYALGAHWTLSFGYHREGRYHPETRDCPAEYPEVVIGPITLYVGDVSLDLREGDLPAEMQEHIRAAITEYEP